jgi:hypothetical protein
LVRTGAASYSIRGRSYSRNQIEAEAETSLQRLNFARQEAAALDDLVDGMNTQIAQLESAIGEGDARVAALEHMRIALEWQIAASETCSRIAGLADSVVVGGTDDIAGKMDRFEQRAISAQAQAQRRMDRLSGETGVIDWDTGETLAERIRAAVPHGEEIAKHSAASE